jgi:hypothetical protein
MKKYSLALLLVIVLSNYTIAQNKFVTRSVGCLYGEAEASITRTGASGSFYIKNTCDRSMYFKATTATVDILQETYDKQTGKYTNKWITKKLSFGDIIMQAGSSARETLTGKDNNVLSALANQENYYTDLRLPNIVLGEGLQLDNNKPNENCVALTYGTTELLEKDGLKYSVKVSSAPSNKVGGFSFYYINLTVFNSNLEKVELLGPVKYNVYVSGIKWTESAEFKKVKANNSEFNSFQSPLTNLEPTLYIEILSTPAIKGQVTANKGTKISQPQSVNTTSNTQNSTKEIASPNVVQTTNNKSVTINQSTTSDSKVKEQVVTEKNNESVSVPTSFSGLWRKTGYGTSNNTENGPFLNIDSTSSTYEYVLKDDGTCTRRACFSKKKIARGEFEYTATGSWKVLNQTTIIITIANEDSVFYRNSSGNLVYKNSGQFESYERKK